MTRDDIQRAVIEALTSVAPEIDPQNLQIHEEIRQSFDLDSMDFLNFVIGVHARLGVEVPEADYGQLSTVGKAVEYVASRLPA